MSLLTLSIPTYNRADFLSKCLNSIRFNESNKDKIELLIIDNNSSDSTEKVVNEYQKKLNIKYIRNEINIGPDENFKKCIKEAKSKYVWIFGDDDLLFENSIDDILFLLEQNKELGLIHLQAKNFVYDIEVENYKYDEFDFKIVNNKKKYISMINTNINFITANIFNKDIVIKNISLDEIPNNNLGQLFWNITAIMNTNEQIFVNTNVFAGRLANRGNYNFAEVFCQNFMDSLYMINEKFPISDVIDVFKKRLLIFYYPANITRIRNDLYNVNLDNCFIIMFRYFKFEPFFWIFTFSALVLPRKICLFIVKKMELVLKK